MNARHISRELFILVLSQLPNIKKKLERVQINDLIEQAIRTLTNEVSSILSIARGELVKADQDLHEASLRSKPEVVREILKSGLDNTHHALELISYCNSIPIFSAMAEKQEIRDFTIKLLKLYQDNPEKVDKIINESLEGGWNIDTIYSIDKNIITLAIVEIMNYENTSHKIIIDEAIEIAKKFGSEESPTFINGVLSGVVKILGISESKTKSLK
ncbi:MAG: transcription antitermination factor NusB [Candidatus Sericytochromatia bacterium]